MMHMLFVWTVGEEIVESLTKICDREKITLATIEGIGAADHAVIGLYNVGEQVYHKTELNGPMEITATDGKCFHDGW